MTAGDAGFVPVAGGVAALLTVATAAGAVLRARVKSDAARRTIDNLNARTRAWWVMALVLGAALAAGPGWVTVLFGLVSFLALREMITLTPTRRADHHTLFWAFFVMIPVQYVLVYLGRVGLFTIVIPVYGFLFLAVRSTLTGDHKDYLRRTAEIQWGVMICVYCLSHAPAVMILPLRDYGPGGWRMLVFLVLVVQLSDVLQYDGPRRLALFRRARFFPRRALLLRVMPSRRPQPRPARSGGISRTAPISRGILDYCCIIGGGRGKSRRLGRSMIIGTTQRERQMTP